jgi:threonine/homoserine/homoserine lactone efflux protein
MGRKIFGTNQIVGLVLIGLSFLIWFLRPFSSCKWWQIFCSGTSLVVTPIFMIICAILLIVGVVKLLIRDRR